MAAALAASPAAWAHPHMWIDARAALQFDAQGRLAAVRQEWLFDEMFGAYATQGLPRTQGGGLSPETLRGLAGQWMGALGEPISHYFTTVTHDGQRQAFDAPRDAAVDWNPATSRLRLSFVLPLKSPVAPGAQGVSVDIYDPTYFVAYDFGEAGSGTVTLQAAPPGCRVAYRPPKMPDFKTLQQLAAIPADPDALPEELFAITKGLTHRIEATCS